MMGHFQKMKKKVAPEGASVGIEQAFKNDWCQPSDLNQF